MSTEKLTRRGARNLTVTLDRIATVFEKQAALLGVDPQIALNFAKFADQMSDAVETTATLNFPKAAAASNGGFDPEKIGAGVPGPLEQLDSDEPWMKGEFTQQEFSELSDKQEKGQLPTNGAKTASEVLSRIARLERILLRLAGEEPEEEKKDEEAKKKAGEEKEEEKDEEAKKKASASDRFAGFNLCE